MKIQLEIEPERPLSVRPDQPVTRNSWIKVVVDLVVEIQLEIKLESPLYVRPARYQRIGALR